jgi:hypothetical protein
MIFVVTYPLTFVSLAHPNYTNHHETLEEFKGDFLLSCWSSEAKEDRNFKISDVTL